MEKVWIAKYKVFVKEDSALARIAAWKLNSKNVAMVLRNTIHLYGVSTADFLNNERWLKHELKHVEQYQQNGTIPFLVKYVIESMKSGYYDNKYEKEAREAEQL